MCLWLRLPAHRQAIAQSPNTKLQLTMPESPALALQVHAVDAPPELQTSSLAWLTDSCSAYKRWRVCAPEATATHKDEAC
jgi:hypothetical protein